MRGGVKLGNKALSTASSSKNIPAVVRSLVVE